MNLNPIAISMERFETKTRPIYETLFPLYTIVYGQSLDKGYNYF